MKLEKNLFFLIILFAFFQIAFGQEKPEAILIGTEGEIINCESIEGQLYGFSIEFDKNPDYKGYVIIYGNKNKQLEKYLFEQQIKNFITNSNYLRNKVYKNQVVILHGEDRESKYTELWAAPSNAAEPAYVKGIWDYKIGDIKKPLKFSVYEEAGICASSFSEELYAKLLINNPNLRGNLVIHDKSLSSKRKTEKQLLKSLVEENKVPQRRLRIFYVKNSQYSQVEYWLVPRKKK
jgi:UDP-2,3-diacylglucosamine pyrophosphatase LpxH